jgi:hypothetical protein
LSVDPLNVDVTPYSPPSSLAVTLTDPSPPAGVSGMSFVIFGSGPMGGMAVFGITGAGTLSPNMSDLGTGTITTPATLISNTLMPAVDLSAYTLGGLLIVDFTSIRADPGTATWPFPGPVVTPTGFRLIAQQQPPPGEVPEPASLILAGTGLLVLTGLAWHRRRPRA